MPGSSTMEFRGRFGRYATLCQEPSLCRHEELVRQSDQRGNSQIRGMDLNLVRPLSSIGPLRVDEEAIERFVTTGEDTHLEKLVRAAAVPVRLSLDTLDRDATACVPRSVCWVIEDVGRIRRRQVCEWCALPKESTRGARILAWDQVVASVAAI